MIYCYYLHFRIEEEGYKAAENIEDSPVQTPISPAIVVQTITLKELIEKNTASDLKVIFQLKFNNCFQNISLLVISNNSSH